MKPLFALRDDILSIWQDIMDLCDEGDGSFPAELQQRLDAVTCEFSVKAENCLRVVKDLGHRALMNRSAAAELLRSAQAGEKHAERLVQYVKTQMELAHIDEFQGELFGGRIQKNPKSVVITDMDLLDPSFFRSERPEERLARVEKASIKAILSDGDEVPGAELRQGTHLRITH